MKGGRRRFAAVLAVAVVFAVLCAASLLLLLSESGEGLPERNSAGADAVLEVRLASRTIHVTRMVKGGVPQVAAAMPQTLSRRGTAPFVLIANGRATAEVRRRAAACGARVSGVIPPHGLVVEADAAALSRIRADGAFAAAEPLTADDKMSASLKRRLAAGAGMELPVTVVPLMGEDAETIAALLRTKGVEPTEVTRKGRGRVRAEVPSDMVASIAARGDVRWVERHVRPRLMNNVAVQPGLMNVTPVRDVHGLTGKGQTITISDSGLDTGQKRTVMADFANRVALINTVSGCLAYDKQGHGTHVAGSIAGNGALSDGEFKGVAYEARLNVWQCMDSDGYLYIPDNEYLFQPDKAKSPSYIHSGSWGGDVDAEYCSECAEKDLWMWNHPENLAVFAAGNYSKDAKHICSPSGAKNVISVGATESLRPDKGDASDNPSAMASFSIKGPMADGRIKPDICAPGTYIVSTRSTKTTETGWGLYSANTSYMYNSGTSMATPLVSGSAALVRQWLVERRGYTNEMPTAALMKAVLTGGAHDMSRDSNADCGGAAPNSSQGWGRVDLGESLYPANAAVKLVDRIPFADGEMFSVRVTTTNAASLAVQLVWTDYPGEYGAAQALVNDLDLVVSNETTGAVWYGNGVDGGDHTNSMESVRISDAAAATYSIMVAGADVPYDWSEGGAAALYVRGTFDDADATNVQETVQLVVSVEGDAAGSTTPAVGTNRITKGTAIVLGADDIVELNGYGTAVRRRAVAGWSGTGDVPASGEGGRVALTLTRDSEIVWRWNGFTNVLLRSCWYMPDYDEEYYYLFSEEWPLLGETVELTVPESAYLGSEAIDLSDVMETYVDYDGSKKALGVQRLGRIEMSEVDGDDFEPMVDGNGHMATRFSLTMDNAVDIIYCYFDEASTNVETSLPAWWYERYMAENPSANDIRFTGVSPTRLEWVGGAGLTRVIERTPGLGTAADWRPVFTNAPAPMLTNTWEVPTAFSTNSFYRIVW